MDTKSKRIRTTLEAEATRERLVRVVRSVLRNDSDAEDAAHDAIVQALVAAEHFRDDAQVSTWLHRIAVNAALMKVRKEARARKNIRAAGETVDAERAPAMAAAAPIPVLALEQARDRQRVRQAISSLPDAYRDVMEKHVLEEAAPDDVAVQLGITTSAVRTRIGRARRRLEVLLAA